MTRVAGTAPAATLLDEAAPIELEVLSPGVHQGFPVTVETMRTMAENFAKLWRYVRPPLRIGHYRPDSAMEPPQAGTVTALAVRPGHDGKPKLFAEVTGIPQLVRRALKQRLWSRTSAELCKEWAKTPDEANLRTGVTGPALVGVSLAGASLPVVKDLRDIVPLLDEPVALCEPPSLASRIAAAEERFAELRRLNAATRARLARLQERPVVSLNRGKPVTQSNKKQSFRASVEAQVQKNGGDPAVSADRLTAARQLLRDLAAAGEVTVSTEDYLHGLATQTELAQRRTPAPSAREVQGGLGGQREREAVGFSEDPRLVGRATMPHEGRCNLQLSYIAPQERSAAAMVHDKAEALAAKRPDMVAGYMSRARTEALPGPLAERLHHHLGKIPVGEQARLGTAMRAAVAEVPGLAPKYGRSQ